MLHDERCPDCRGKPSVTYFNRDRIDKRCNDCGHKYSEERTTPDVEIVKGGYVRFKGWRR